ISTAFQSSMKDALDLVWKSSSIFWTSLKASCDGRHSTPGLNSFSVSKVLSFQTIILLN
ncbi:hypothetical protein ILYODFUR_023441, partial [Ilyodon furcidens]